MPAVGWEERRKTKDHLNSLKIESVRTVEDHSSYEWAIIALTLTGLATLSVPYLFGRYILGARRTLSTVRNIPHIIP